METAMDLYGDDRKLSELSEELNEFLDSGAFTPTSSDSGCGLDTYGSTGMDEDWLESFFEDPVLNDRMISDALQPPTIRHEHSYSLSNSENNIDSPINLCKVEPMDQEIDADLLTASTTNATSATQLNLTLDPMTMNKRTLIPKSESENQKRQTCTDGNNSNSNNNSGNHIHHISQTETTLATQQLMNCNRTAQPTVVHKQPTIILATTQTSLSNSQCSNSSTRNIQSNKHERLVLPKVNIKVEPQETSQGSPEHTSSYHNLDLPPTPPSSNTSDSEGGQSPTRSAPSSPVRQSSLRVSSQFAISTISHSSLFSSPVSQAGVLMLTEEEKRTLVSEGYPIPQKLPLTKQEEKNLKKIRRKIKNKISAQESRRKKKEYLETLEKKVEVYNQENCDLKKKVESLETNNRSLLSQLQKLQSIVSKITKPVNSTQSSCLMVFVLCFAVFLGAYSPSNFSIGYSRAGATPSAIKMPMGPAVKGAQVDAYVTTKMRSRVLLSLKEEQEESELYGPATPFSYRDMLVNFFHGSGGYVAEAIQAVGYDNSVVNENDMQMDSSLDPEMPKVHITDAQPVADANLHNETGEQKMAAQAAMHPDITANIPAAVENTSA